MKSPHGSCTLEEDSTQCDECGLDWADAVSQSEASEVQVTS